MTEPTWEIEAPSLAITICWGDVALHTAHLDPPRSFFLGGFGADCVLPEGAVGAGRVPLILAERGAVYLVLHPAMDPEGAIAAPNRGARTVADLARAGISEASSDVLGGFLVKLVPGMTAALTIGDFTIAITLETKAACAVAGHFHFSRRMVPFQLGSAVLHLALLGVLLTFAGPPRDPNEVSEEQLRYLQGVFQSITAKEEAELGEDYEPPIRLQKTYSGYGGMSVSLSNDRYVDYTSARRRRIDRGRIGQRNDGAPAREEIYEEDDVSAPIDPRAHRTSTFAVNVGTDAYEAARLRLRRSELPTPSSVLPEEFLNSFDYGYPNPDRSAEAPFAAHLAAAPSPFEAGHYLIRIGVQGRRSTAPDRSPDAWREVLARGVRIKVDFNPNVVRSYRRLGDEAHDERDEDPRDQRRDGGEIGAGDSVTAVYDVVLTSTASSPVTLRIQYRTRFGYGEERESVFTLSPRAISPSFDEAPASLRLAAGVAGFAEILSKSPHTEGWRLADVERITSASAGSDENAQELTTLVHTARSLEDARLTSRWSGRVVDASLMGF